MAKRFSDSEKWKRPWFRCLPVPYKLFWIYLLDECDFCGVWYVDMDLASFVIGERLDREAALELFSKQIREIDGGNKWFVVDFISFQYGELRTTNNLHRSVLRRLESQGLGRGRPGVTQPLSSPSPGAKEKEKEEVVSLSLKHLCGENENQPLLLPEARTMRPKELMELWNQTRDPVLAAVKGLSGKRERLCRLRLNEHPERDFWVSVICRLNDSDFCKGAGGTGWRVDFDFLIANDTNVLKIQEGKYDNRDKGPGEKERLIL